MVQVVLLVIHFYKGNMKYEQLGTDYIDDVIAEAMYAREVEYFHYEFDKQNFEEILKQSLDLDYKKQMEERIKNTLIQMEQVELVYSALKNQIRNPEAHKKAVKRTSLKRNK
jgi:predicted transcriptional regulator